MRWLRRFPLTHEYAAWRESMLIAQEDAVFRAARDGETTDKGAFMDELIAERERNRRARKG